MSKFILIISLFLLPLFTFSQTADFSFQSDSTIICTPATINFTQNCTGNPLGFVWDFGDNTKAYEPDVSVTYDRPGTYTVKLIAIYNSNAATVTKTIVVNPAITASIGYDKNYICKPGPINFSANTNAKMPSYLWDFGDTTGLVNSATKDTTHDYANFGDYPVTLVVTDTTGCVGRTTSLVKVNKPDIVATGLPFSGCIPALVRFNANVTVPANDFVSSISWNFGDGTPVVSTPTRNTSHSYTATGVYYPTMSVVTNGGCTNTYNFHVVAYGTPPFNHTAYPKKAVFCGSDTALFVSKAVNANSYVWDYGDGIIATIADTITSHKYSTLGIKKVKVTPFFNSCPGTPVSFDIEVIGVIAKFAYSNTCADKKTYLFTNNSLGNLSSILWNFGDSATADTSRNVTHLYPDSGRFNTSLLVTDSVSGCSDTHRQSIFTANPVIINFDSSICKNDSTIFSIANSYTNSSTTYTWNITGVKIGPTPDSSITVKASTLGIFNNFVSINYDSRSCLDTIPLNHTLLVRGPDLKYNAPSPICFNAITTLTNSSKPYIPADSITLMYWNYGNSRTNDTTYQPFPFQYRKSGNYRVILTAVDVNGCRDSLIKFVRVNPNPFLQVIPHSDTLCFGQIDTLIAFSSDSVLWSPGGHISCTTCDTVAVNPDVTTQYVVTSTTRFNCTKQDSIFIRVFSPFTATVPTNKFYICRNEQVTLDADPKNKIIVWSPATGLSGAGIYHPVASPQATTTYMATLTDSVGCFSDSATVDVNVKAQPTVDAGPDRIVPYNAAYTISPAYSNNIASYSWTPSSLLNCSNCPAPNGNALHSETYTIKVTSDSGCVATDVVTIFVECKSANLFMPSAFTPNNDNLNDTYYPITRGIKTILKFVIYNRQGKIVYEASNFTANNKSFGWNGDYRGEPQSPAAYVYVLEALCEVGEKLTKTGSFLLLR